MKCTKLTALPQTPSLDLRGLLIIIIIIIIRFVKRQNVKRLPEGMGREGERGIRKERSRGGKVGKGERRENLAPTVFVRPRLCRKH